jgi:hypothetical protein
MARMVRSKERSVHRVKGTPNPWPQAENSSNAYAYQQTRTLLGAGAGDKAPDNDHLEPSDFLNLYKTAHFGSMVDKSNKS